MLRPEDIAPYLQKELPKHGFYDESLKIAKGLQVHSRGESPTEILDLARPNEEPQYKAYRKDVYKPITKTYFSKVLTTVSKINRAEDWKIRYSDKIKENVLQTYMERDYPYFDTFSNWFFSLALQQMCDDPNGAIAILPLTPAMADNEFLQPFAFLFDSKQVIHLEENKLAVLEDKQKSLLRRGTEMVATGRILHIFDKTDYIKLVQTGEENADTLTFEQTKIIHNIGYMPVIKLGGLVRQFSSGSLLYDSFLSPCQAFWDEAIARYSDHQVNMVLHLHPDQWEIADTPCPAKGCKDGKINERNSLGALVSSTCNTCHGNGNVTTRTPFGRRILNASVQTGISQVSQIPTPPAGYVDRPIESISFLKQEYLDNIKQGLQAVNMEWLMNEPDINSGVAKALDRQELNTFIYSIARHIIENIFEPCYYFTNKWRFGKVSGHENLMPEIPVPEKFDLLTSDIAATRLATAIEKNFSPALINKLQSEYARKDGNEQEALLIEVTQKLDPLPYLTPDEKNELVINTESKGTSYNKYVISCNLPAYINRAMFEKKDFLSLDYKSQMALLRTYAEEDIAEEKASVVPLFGAINANNPNMDTPVDVEAESKAKLKGSVGGVQGILEIQKSVSEGITTYDAGLAILDLIYGIADTEGRRILGDPKKVQLPKPAVNDFPPAATA